MALGRQHPLAAILTLAVAACEAALPLAERVVTRDSLTCQRVLCAQIPTAQGDYLVVIKTNQSILLAEVALLFDQPPPGEVFDGARADHT